MFFVPIFEENRISILGVVFCSRLPALEIIVFDKKFVYPIKNIGSLKSNKKKFFLPPIILQSFGKLKNANLFMLWTNLCAFLGHILNAKIVILFVVSYPAQQICSKLN